MAEKRANRRLEHLARTGRLVGRFFAALDPVAVDPEVTIPIASKSKLYGFLNLRYFWETGTCTTLEGNTFILTFSMPVPSIPLQSPELCAVSGSRTRQAV